MNGRVHFFAGIGGIGMSALARHLIAQGAVVHGYDRQPSALTKGSNDLARSTMALLWMNCPKRSLMRHIWALSTRQPWAKTIHC